MANSADPDQILISMMSHLVYTICPGLSVLIFRVSLVDKIVHTIKIY